MPDIVERPPRTAPPTTASAGARDAAPRLRTRALRLGYGAQVVVPRLDLDIVDGSVTAIVGPNGCGKSTLLRALGRLLRPTAGEVLLDGQRIQQLPTREVARRLGILPQSPSAPDGLTVADLVMRGRQPHQSWLRQWSRADEQVVTQALAWTGLTELATHPVDTLSGGQRQRAWISMALAQGTDILLLDEPTTYLDLAHQIDVLELVDRLHREHGRTVVMVLHDLNLAARYARQLIAMKDGEVLAGGPPAQVLTPELVEQVFGLRVMVIEDPASGTPLVVPLAGSAARASTIEKKSIPMIRAVTG
ncbi:ABC transporter ATP-binding protein [Solwaraspora sp. WMMB335]|uniref:ABC transporter ATP-binding protein n=1 Tax=Solwaraspora sp. WMMB335 TaxID=3404118 RepID=UPI003B95DC2A